MVEKAIRFSKTEDRVELVYSLVFYKSEGFHRVPMLLKDPYANFVFQVSCRSCTLRHQCSSKLTR